MLACGELTPFTTELVPGRHLPDASGATKVFPSMSSTQPVGPEEVVGWTVTAPGVVTELWHTPLTIVAHAPGVEPLLDVDDVSGQAVTQQPGLKYARVVVGNVTDDKIVPKIKKNKVVTKSFFIVQRVK